MYKLIRYKDSLLHSTTFFCTRYIQQHYIHQLNQTPNYNYLGHPINAYHFIRHVASGWDLVLKDMLENKSWLHDNYRDIKRYKLFDDLGMLRDLIVNFFFVL